eukprot:1750529-Rhodomonas_salina.3
MRAVVFTCTCSPFEERHRSSTPCGCKTSEFRASSLPFGSLVNQQKMMSRTRPYTTPTRTREDSAEKGGAALRLCSHSRSHIRRCRGESCKSPYPQIVRPSWVQSCMSASESLFAECS